MDSVKVVTAHKLSILIRNEKALIIDSRTFCEFNTSHIHNAVNVWSSKIRKKRLQQDSISVHDYLAQACHVSEVSSGVDIIVYDHSAPSLSAVPQDSFLHVLLTKLGRAFPGVYLLAGGFLEFQARYPELCEDSSKKGTPLTTQSQPCMPVANIGPTRILPFLYLGSQNDANNTQLLQSYNIVYELNVSVSCPKPEFVQDSHFMRIPVNDNFSEKLMPYFNDAFNFIDKVREGGGCVLVHCLAGVSRSATVAIAYVMKHLSLPFEEAYMYVKTRRPTISPNINFVGQLAELDRQLRRDPKAPRDPVSAPVLLRPPATPASPALPHTPTSPDRPPAGHLSKSLSLNLGCGVESVLGSASPHVLARTPSDLSPSTALARLTFPPSTPPPPGPRIPRSPVFTFGRGCGSPCSPSTPAPCPFFRGRLGSGVALLRGEDTQRLTTGAEESIREVVGRPRHPTTKADAAPTPAPASTPIPATPPAGPRPRQVSVCVIEVKGKGGAEPVQYLRGEPMVVRETTVEAMPVRPSARCHLQVDLTPPQPQPPHTNTTTTTTTITTPMPHTPLTPTHTAPTTPITPTTLVPTTPLTPITPTTPGLARPVCGRVREVVVPIRREVQPAAALPCPGTPAPPKGGVWSPDSPHEAAVAGPAPARPGSPVPPGVQQSDSGILVAGLNSSGPVSPALRLPRCHSSSETHLSTRRLLEHLPPDFSARKCSSYDEVGRAWPLCPAHPAPAPPRAWELARSDSVSTSGFGSEISDSDFLGEDGPAPQDDPLGPYQAVFADVFPGEGPPAPLHHQPRRHPAPITPAPRAPRPASLPGVTGTYFSHLQSRLDSEPSLDMGVELDRDDDDDDDDEEEEEEVVKGFELRRAGRRGRRGVEKKDSGYYSFLTEHPPVNPKTMGEGVRHTSNSPWRRERPKNLQLQNTTTTITTPTSPPPPLTPPPSSSTSPSSTTSTTSSSSSSSEKRMTPEKRKNRGSSVEEKEEKRRSCEMEGGGGGWSPSLRSGSSVTIGTGALTVARQLVRGVEQLLDAEMADLRRRTAAASSRIRLLGRSEDPARPSPAPVPAPSITPSPSPKATADPDRDSHPHGHTQGRLRPPRGTRPTPGESGRARSEPPLPAEEGLYRARSCPGLPRSAGVREAEGEAGPLPEVQVVRLRGGLRGAEPRAPPLNRYSCGALDGAVPPPAVVSATFESCPDFGSLRQCVRHGDSHHSSSSSISSTHSFTRLLQVS